MANLPHILWFLFTNFAWRKNACSNYRSYFVRDVSSSCWSSPDFGGLVPQTIERYIGKLETCNVTTDDGYILTLFRMPRDNPKGVLILQHGYVADSSAWFFQFNESIALYFYNAGYDVWLPNNRNTRYSQSHKTLKSSDKSYWNFSFHEQGVYDHKADIKLIREKTGNQNIFFIGDSLSSGTALIYASTHPEEAKESIKMFFLLAPVAQMEYIRTPSKYAATFYPAIELPVVISVNLVCGWNPTEIEPASANMLFANTPTFGSWKTLYHLGQLKNSKRFQMYDYGSGQNLKRYGTKKPPLYPLDKIRAPIFVMHFEKDSVSTVKDVNNLYSSLPKIARAGKVLVPNMNHIDPAVGKHSKERILVKILEALEKYR